MELGPGAGPAIAGGVLSGLQSVLGIAQYIKGAKMKPVRPNYDIPGQIREAEGLARERLYGGLPGENVFRQDIETGFANSIDAARRAGGNTDALVSNAGGALQGNYQSLSAQRAQFKSAAEAALASQLGLSAQYEDQAFELNEMQPYKDMVADKSRLMEGGLQNIFGGAKGAVNAYAYGNMAKNAWPETPNPEDFKKDNGSTFDDAARYAKGMYGAANPAIYDERFADPELFVQAITHSNYVGEMNKARAFMEGYKMPTMPSWGMTNYLNGDF